MSGEFILTVKHFVAASVILEWASENRSIRGMDQTVSLQFLSPCECFPTLLANKILLLAMDSCCKVNKKSMFYRERRELRTLDSGEGLVIVCHQWGRVGDRLPPMKPTF